MKKFFVDADIRKAETLSANFYTSKECYDISKEKIFASTWQFIGETDNVKVPGMCTPTTILDGFLDEPILLARDKDDSIHCISNVCTHRGNLVVEGPCLENNLRCRYHGRRFKLNGKFESMPEFEGVEKFPREKDDLPKVPFGLWNKLIFASVKPAVKLDDIIGEMKKRVGFLPLNEFKHEPVRSRDYLVKAHWSLYCENYLEGFHIPYIHPGLSSAIDYNTYTTELYKYSNLQLALAKGGEEHFNLPANHPDYGKKVAAYYYWLFPNMMFNFYPWGLSINIVKPLAPDLTKVSFITYIYDSTKLERGAGGILDKVEREDEAIVELVQKGIKSRMYSGGRYSPKRETGTHHMHQLICEFMNR